MFILSQSTKDSVTLRSQVSTSACSMNTDKVVGQNCELLSTSSINTDSRLDLHCEDGVSDTSTIDTEEDFDCLLKSCAVK